MPRSSFLSCSVCWALPGAATRPSHDICHNLRLHYNTLDIAVAPTHLCSLRMYAPIGPFLSANQMHRVHLMVPKTTQCKHPSPGKPETQTKNGRPCCGMPIWEENLMAKRSHSWVRGCLRWKMTGQERLRCKIEKEQQEQKKQQKHSRHTKGAIDDAF